MAEYTYVVDFASVVFICRSICNTAEAGKESLRKRVERVAGYFLFDLPLLVAAWKRRKSFTVARSGASTCCLRIPVPYSSFVENCRRQPKIEEASLGFERGACRLTLDSPPLPCTHPELTLNSTSLRVRAGKSGVAWVSESGLAADFCSLLPRVQKSTASSPRSRPRVRPP